MEDLEKIALETKLSVNETEEKNLEVSENYEGLILIESKDYTGGTSIKYWM